MKKLMIMIALLFLSCGNEIELKKATEEVKEIEEVKEQEDYSNCHILGCPDGKVCYEKDCIDAELFAHTRFVPEPVQESEEPVEEPIEQPIEGLICTTEEAHNIRNYSRIDVPVGDCCSHVHICRQDLVCSNVSSKCVEPIEKPIEEPIEVPEPEPEPIVIPDPEPVTRYEGETCNSRIGFCDSGLRCKSGRCVLPECLRHTDCSSDERCDSNYRCARRLERGYLCSGGNNRSCVENLICFGGRCVEKSGTGGGCRNSNDCQGLRSCVVVGSQFQCKQTL